MKLNNKILLSGRLRRFNIRTGFPIPKGYGGICLFPFGVYLKPYCAESQTLLNHEFIHWKQQKETLCIFFYILYGIFFLYNLIKYKGHHYYAYSNIPFEKEAFLYADNLNYLGNRPLFNWLRWKKVEEKKNS